MKIITVIGEREIDPAIAERVRLEAAVSLKVSDILEQREREKYRPVDAPDRASVKRAMASVEARIVDAVWTLARLPESGRPSGRCGLDYIQDRADRFSNAVANGGKWDAPTPRPSLPSSRSIDAMDAPLSWLSLLPREQGKLVSVAAGTKRGDPARYVSWSRVRMALPELNGQTIRTLQRRYEDGIRTIAGALT